MPDPETTDKEIRALLAEMLTKDEYVFCGIEINNEAVGSEPMGVFAPRKVGRACRTRITIQAKSRELRRWEIDA